MYGSAERSFVAPGSLGRLCRVAFCCTRATWTAVQSGPLLHQGHLEGCAERPFVVLGPRRRLCRAAFCAPGPLGRLCRADVYCTRATWKTVQSCPLLH